MITRLSAGCLVLLTTVAVAIRVAAQPGSSSTLPSPSRYKLVPVHLPDTTKLEPEVRDQLNSLQASLSAVLKDPSASQSTLAEAYGAVGQTYHAYMLTLPAGECYVNASLLEPKDFRWVYLLGRIAQREDLVDPAISQLVAARALRPDYVPIHVNLGNVLLQLNRLEEAVTSFKAALALDKTNAAALYGLGQVALSQHCYAAAVSFFEQALQRVPEANKIHYSLAMAYRGLGDLAQAKAHLAQQGTVGVRVVDPLVDQLPELVAGERVHLIRGRMAFDAKRFQDAAAEFRKAIAKKSDSVSAHLNLGNSLVQLNDLPAAATEFETVLRLDPKNVNARFNLAVLLAKEDKHEQAIGHLQSLLKVNPNDVAARLFLAQELLKLQRRSEALNEFAQVSRADPDNEEALLQEVILLQDQKQDKQALERLTESYAQYPARTQTAATLAYLFAASPQYNLRSGERALELAQNIFKQTGLAQHGALLVTALAELGRCNEAADWQRKMIALAEQQQQTALAARLKASLNFYEGAVVCRLPGQ